MWDNVHENVKEKKRDEKNRTRIRKRERISKTKKSPEQKIESFITVAKWFKIQHQIGEYSIQNWLSLQNESYPEIVLSFCCCVFVHISNEENGREKKKIICVCVVYVYTHSHNTHLEKMYVKIHLDCEFNTNNTFVV